MKDKAGTWGRAGQGRHPGHGNTGWVLNDKEASPHPPACGHQGGSWGRTWRGRRAQTPKAQIPQCIWSLDFLLRVTRNHRKVFLKKKKRVNPSGRYDYLKTCCPQFFFFYYKHITFLIEGLLIKINLNGILKSTLGQNNWSICQLWEWYFSITVICLKYAFFLDYHLLSFLWLWQVRGRKFTCIYRKANTFIK